MKKTTCFLLFAMLFVAGLHFPACYKERPEPEPEPPRIPYWDTLPAITQTGANTFGCLVNGKVWVPRVQILVPWYDLAASLNEFDGTGSCGIDCILLTETQDDYLTMGFGPTYFSPVTCYGKTSIMPQSNIIFQTEHVSYTILPKDSLNNWVKVSMVDTDRNIVSGTFQFKMYNDQNPNKVLNITDGRFDLKYHPE
jgi:hypothetical protein